MNTKIAIEERAKGVKAPDLSGCSTLYDVKIRLSAEFPGHFIYQGGNHVAVHREQGDPKRMLLVTERPTNEPLLAEYYDPEQYDVVEEKDSNTIARILCSQTSATWGAGPIPDTEYYKLAQLSPSKKGGKILLTVCKRAHLDL